MSIERYVGTEEWYDANPEKFAVYNAQYLHNGERFYRTMSKPWVAVGDGASFYRECETFQDALNYALDKAAKK